MAVLKILIDADDTDIDIMSLKFLFQIRKNKHGHNFQTFYKQIHLSVKIHTKYCVTHMRLRILIFGMSHCWKYTLKDRKGLTWHKSLVLMISELVHMQNGNKSKERSSKDRAGGRAGFCLR